MLCFAGIVPHPPVIIPTIGRDNSIKAQKTIQAFKKLSKELAEAKPDVLIVISCHEPVFPDAFCLNLSQEYQGDFKSFGDLTTKMSFKNDLELVYKIKEYFETSSPILSLTMITEPNLDHEILIPLYYLNEKWKNFSLIPLGCAGLDYQKHLDFGQKLKEEIVLTNKRVGVIASAGLSYCSAKDIPKDSSIGEQFDQKLIKLIKNKKTDQILKLDQDLIKQSGECGLRSILMLLGILKDFSYKPQVLSYQNPLGAGYLVLNFKISN